MKVAPLHRAFLRSGEIDSKIVHTGQHYDVMMSDIFFEQLELPKPDYYLGIRGGTNTEQLAKIMLAFEPILRKEQPDLVLVVGDVTSTLAAALVASKSNIAIAHVEAGLRSRDKKMPEEINRILTDSMADFLFVTERAGLLNLAKENIPESKVFFTGNCMIDSLVHYRKKANELNISDLCGENLTKGSYILMTMHRPSNVDTEKGLQSILRILKDAASLKKVIFPIHPRTMSNMKQFRLDNQLLSIDNLILLEPQGYLTFLKLMENAALIVTDSGGIQEETTYLQIPCLTFRKSTERPITSELGTNQLLADLDPETVKNKIIEILEGKIKKSIIPPFWDGQASVRITEILIKNLLK
jgi:UDP-N-acetylglucosamine 2-epimerase (non-hydrolysing)